MLFWVWLGVLIGVLIPLGISSALPLSLLWTGTLLMCVVLIGGQWIFRQNRWMFWAKWSPLGMGILSLSLSMLFVTSRIHERLVHHWPESLAGSAVTVEGWVDDLPRPADYGVRLSLRVTALDRTDLSSFPERLWLTSYLPSRTSSEDIWNPRAGECWRMTVRLKPPHGLMSPHTFDVETWLLSHGFDATGSRVSHSVVERLDQCSASWVDPWMQQLQRVRQRLKDHLQKVLGDGPYTGVMIALVIGDQPAIPDVQWQRFNATGIGHLISISGFHITFLASIAAWLVQRLVRWSPRCLDYEPDRVWGAVTGLLVAIAYVLLAGGGVPAQRTAWMIGVMAVGWSLGRWTHVGVLFVWATIGVLLIDPLAPLAAGFWLSFVGVGALMLSGLGRLPFIPVKRYDFLRHALHSQIVATLVLAPMTLYLFGQVSVVGPLANALAIPMISIVITPLALCGALIPGMSWALHGAYIVFAWLDQGLQWLVQISIFPTVWRGAEPSLWATVLATFGMLYLCGSQILPMRWVIGCFSLLPLWVLPNVQVRYGAARITVLDVGQGLSVLIETAGHRLLYDAGPRPFRAPASSNVDAGARVILPFLRGEGITSLDTLLISHHDIDHRGGADSLLAQMPIRQLLTSVDSASFPTRKPETDFIPCETGQKWTWDGVSFFILSPTSDRLAHEKRSNDLSCVLRVETAAASVLLPGDAESSVENELIQTQPQLLQSTVLIAGHHGSRTSTSLAWLESVRPSYTVFTSGYINHYHHPHPEVVERVSQSGSMAFRSDAHGALVFELPGQAGETIWRSWRNSAGRSWHYGRMQ